MVSVAKKSTDKISIGGRKFALRRRDAARGGRGRGRRHRRSPRSTTATTARCWCRWCATARSSAASRSTTRATGTSPPAPSCPCAARRCQQGRAGHRDRPHLSASCCRHRWSSSEVSTRLDHQDAISGDHPHAGRSHAGRSAPVSPRAVADRVLPSRHASLGFAGLDCEPLPVGKGGFGAEAASCSALRQRAVPGLHQVRASHRAPHPVVEQRGLDSAPPPRRDQSRPPSRRSVSRRSVSRRSVSPGLPPSRHRSARPPAALTPSLSRSAGRLRGGRGKPLRPPPTRGA